MKLELPDNAREAFQFLVLGVCIVLLFRLLAVGFGLVSGNVESDALAQACAPFRNGYPLIGRHSVVVGGLEMIPRVAVAALFSLLCAVVVGFLAWSIAAALKGSKGRALVVGGRIGLLVGGAWACYCLLCVPAAWTEVKEDGLVLHHHTAFLGQVPWPFSGTETRCSLSHVDQFLITNHPPDKDPAILAYAASDVFVIAKPPSGSAAYLVFDEQWHRNATQLIEALEALPHR